jgi:hypothetical protein
MVDPNSAWGTLMAAPWGQHSYEAKAAKVKALAVYEASWTAWRNKRVAEGKWVGSPTTYAEV